MPEPKVYRYKAFITYARQDAAFARWLRKNIENYTIPGDVRNKYPNLPNDLKSSIFLNEENLSSRETLSQTLQEGIDDAESMIVLCSPRALLSKRVEDEIVYFRSKHKERKVIALLIDGKADNVIPKALPLQSESPLLIDISHPKTRKKAFLEAIASLLGIDMGALWQTEVQKTRKKRILKIAIAALFLLIGGYTYMKMFSGTPNKELRQIERQIDALKKEREVQKAEAQTFHKLSVSLKELEVLKRQKEGSLKYFRLLKNTKAEEVYNEKGVDAALVMLESSLPSSIVDKKDASFAVKNILLAKLYIEKGDIKKAEQYYANAVDADGRYTYLLEYATFLREHHELKKLESMYEKMRTYDFSNEEKAEVYKNPEKYNLDLAKIYNSLALYYAESGESTKAQEMYTKVLALWEALEKKHKGVYKPEVGASLTMLGKFYSSTDRVEAQKYFERAVKIQRELYKEDPKHFAPALVNTLGELALLYQHHEAFDKAETLYREVLPLERALYLEDPDLYLDRLQDTVNHFARLLSQTKREEEAKKLFEEADSYEKLRAKRVTK